MQRPGSRPDRLVDIDPYLVIHLRAASDMWGWRIRGYDEATMSRRAQAASHIIGCYGDVLQYGRKQGSTGGGRNLIDTWLRLGLDEYGYREDLKPAPTTAEVFNALAEGCAIIRHMTGVDPLTELDRGAGDNR